MLCHGIKEVERRSDSTTNCKVLRNNHHTEIIPCCSVPRYILVVPIHIVTIAADATKPLRTMEKQNQQQEQENYGPGRQDDPMGLSRSVEPSQQQQHSHTTTPPRTGWTRKRGRIGTGFGMDCATNSNGSCSETGNKRRSAAVQTFNSSIVIKLLTVLAVIATAAGTTHPRSIPETYTGSSQSVKQLTVDRLFVDLMPDLPDIRLYDTLDSVDCDDESMMCCSNFSRRVQLLLDVDGSFCDCCGDNDDSSSKQKQQHQQQQRQEGEELENIDSNGGFMETSTSNLEERTKKAKKTRRQTKEDMEILVFGFLFTMIAVATSLVAHLV